MYPLLQACEKDNIEIIQILIEYALNNNINLELNEKHEKGYYPLFWACNNNMKIVHLLSDYAKKSNTNTTLELIPIEFFKNNELRFKSELENLIQRIHQGSELKNEITFLEDFCQNEVEVFRKRANETFKKWVTEVYSIHESKIKDIISVEDEEIKVLQEKLNNVLTLPNIQEGKREIYDQQKKESEEKIRKIKEEESKIILQVPEMVTKEQVDGVLSNLLEELNEIKEKIKNSNDTDKNVENTLKQIQFIYNVNIKILISSLKTEFHRDLDDIALQYDEKEYQIKEAYEAEKNILKQIIDEIMKK